MRRLTAVIFVIAGSIPLVLTSGRAQGPAGGGPVEIERAGGHDAVAREALVKFRGSPRRRPEVLDLAAAVEAVAIDPIGRTGAFRVRSRTLDADTLVARLAARPDVEYAEPNFVVRALGATNDPYLSWLWGLERIHAPAAWDRTTGSTAHVVAVIDTGIEYTHRDLAPNMWTAPAAFTVTVGGKPVHCAAGSHGFNAIRKTCDPMDDAGHGTHVAGTIGAVGDNQLGVVGVNWTARLMGIKFLDAQGAGTIADAIDAIQFAMEAKEAFAASDGADVRILSNSWGGSGFSQALFDEVEAANEADMLVVAAAGNSGLDNDLFPTYPASFAAPNVIAVAATTSSDSLAWFSNYGAASVHLAAPGDLILSTVRGDSYGYSSGTSMATPHVSGAAALMLSMCTASTATLKEALLGTVDRLPALAARTIAGGRLNVHSALYACAGPPAAPANLAAAAGDTRVGLTWEPALGATRYIVKRGATQGGPYETIAPAVSGPAFTDTSVVNDTTYYYVVAAANGLGESGDSNEASATPRAPSNLSITGFTAPSGGGAGLPLTVSFTTVNQGPGWAAPTTTALFLSTNGTRDASDRRLSPDQPVGRLDAGGSVASTLTVTIPDDVAVGTYYLFATADADSSETESVESNNNAARILRIGPDLIVSFLTVPAKGGAGAAITVTPTAKNQGGAPSPASDLTFYLSANGVLDAGDTALSEGDPVPELGPTATYTATIALLIPASTPTGAYYLIAKVDADAAVVETSDSNNTRAGAIRIGPDLRVSSLTKSASTVAAGGTVAVTETVLNQGGGPAEVSQTTGFYLSPNFTFSADDIPLGSRSVPPLLAGQSNAGTTTIAIPAGTAAGTYYVLAVADSTNALVETFETNNVTGSLIKVTISP